MLLFNAQSLARSLAMKECVYGTTHKHFLDENMYIHMEQHLQSHAERHVCGQAMSGPV